MEKSIKTNAAFVKAYGMPDIFRPGEINCIMVSSRNPDEFVSINYNENTGIYMVKNWSIRSPETVFRGNTVQMTEDQINNLEVENYLSVF